MAMEHLKQAPDARTQHGLQLQMWGKDLHGLRDGSATDQPP